MSAFNAVTHTVYDSYFFMSDTIEGAAGPFSGKDPGQSSPMSDRKKNRRKKSMNQKGDAAVGQAEGKSTQKVL